MGMQLPPNSIIASGPVIIEDNKVLLNREKKENGITPWMFPGGEVEEFDKSLEEACHREVGEEMGIKIEIIKPLKPIMIYQNERVIILAHYLAKRIGEISPGKDISEWAWHDINNLPNNCAQNVYDIISSL
ncbi:MAG: NUDIX hydrolase [Candidatus Magasanikbacteria bacterium]|nr:NUDIX hydrolase [Candidatus Magasanikbacteria bacterium]